MVKVSPGDQRRCCVVGISVDVCHDVVAAAISLRDGGGGQIVTLNAEITMMARALPSLRDTIAAAELVIPDGAGVIWALECQNVRVSRIPGIELAWSLLQYAATHSWAVALVGGAPEVRICLQQRLPKCLPGLQLNLVEHGYQEPQQWLNTELRLAQLRPDLVLVALGAPHQELWSHRVRQGLPGIWMGVGGSFDVWAGVKRRAPTWIRHCRIEWLYRLLQEPGRWRRTLSIPVFVWTVLWHRHGSTEKRP
ncbi:glycosyltransferase [cyanobiont of Ornithocercus magnificus]|nr:glycosyltransferase [cyanobiont of Ornithocercus magnificus]